MKKCSECKISKELTLFPFRKDSRDGRKGVCRLCNNARIKLRRSGALDSALEKSRRQKAARLALPVEIGLCSRCDARFSVTCNGRDICTDCLGGRNRKKYMTNQGPRETKRKYYINNNEKCRNRSRRSYIENTERCKALQRINGPIWASKNRGKCAARLARYYTAKKNAAPLWLTQVMVNEMELVYIESASKTKETGMSHNVDHIVPLQGKTVSGLHVPWNLQILTKMENCRKSNKLLIN